MIKQYSVYQRRKYNKLFNVSLQKARDDYQKYLESIGYKKIFEI